MAAPTFEELIPRGHKFAIRAIRVSNGAVKEPVELAPGLRALPAFPVNPPSHWVEWIGQREFSIARECELVLLTTEEATALHVHDDQSRRLEAQLQAFGSALSITTPGFAAPWGLAVTGSRNADRLSLSNHSHAVPYHSAPGTPRSWTTTRVHLEQATEIARAMANMRRRVNGSTDRLMRIFFAFHQGMSAQTWDVRAHQFCRVLDGFVATRHGQGKADFSSRCSQLIADTDGKHREFFEQAYVVRGSVEHLRGPAAAIRTLMPALASDKQAYLHLAYLAFVVEHVARHAMLHVCRTPELWDPLRNHAQATEMWTNGTGPSMSPLDIEAVMKAFDGERVQSFLEMDA